LLRARPLSQEKAMIRMIVKSRVGDDGVLHVTVPLGPAEANRDVQLTIESASTEPMSQEEWRKLVMSMAGSISDPTFRRHEESSGRT
jgi:hypothetical protein